MLYEPGSDITSFLWQYLQQNTIQEQLNRTHDMYQNHHRIGQQQPPPPPSTQKKKYWLYTEAVKQAASSSSPKAVEKYLTAYVPPVPREDVNFLNDVTVFDDSLTNLMELRRVKLWAKYMLSDGVIRYGTIQTHPLYNVCPGWLMDVLWHQKQKKNLTLVWCTDIRGVNEYLGSLCSTINLHHLFRRLEKKDRNNYSAILLQMTVLSTEALNPINRRGIKFPQAAVTACTFENIKRSLSAMKKKKKKKINTVVEYKDNVAAPFTRLMLAMPVPIGTNYFDIKI